MKIYSYRVKALEKEQPDAVMNFSKDLEKVFNYYHSSGLGEDGQYDRRRACKKAIQSLNALDRVARREGIGKLLNFNPYERDNEENEKQLVYDCGCLIHGDDDSAA